MKKSIVFFTIMAMTLTIQGCANSKRASSSETSTTSDNAGTVASVSSTDVSTDAEEGATEAGTAEAAAPEVSTVEPGVLQVAMECSYAPYNWTQTDDSNGAVQIKDSPDYANGYDVMTTKKIADYLGLKPQIVKLDWDSLVPAVQSGTVDCVIAGQSMTKERKESVDFSTPYYYTKFVVLVRKDSKYADAKGLSDLSGATATSQINTTWYDYFLPQIPGVNIQPAQKTVPQMMVALDSKSCDVLVCDMPTALSAQVAYPDFKILDFSDTNDGFDTSDEQTNIGCSVKKGNTALLDAINTVLSSETKDDFEEQMEEAIKIQPMQQ